MGEARQKIIVVGAGIIGAVCAWQLQRSGADVVIVGGGAGRATDASFGWINGSYYLDSHHMKARTESMAAYTRLAQALDVPVAQVGALVWDQEPEALRAMAEAMRATGYPVEEIGPQGFAAMEPNVMAAPELALMFPSEAAAESGSLADRLLAQAVALGARWIGGVTVEGLSRRGDVVSGVRTAVGEIEADQVLIAAGTGSARILADVGFDLPMLSRPAYILRTRPVPPLTRHILAAPIGEIRQLPDGRLLMPTTPGHQGDKSDRVPQTPEEAGARAMEGLKGLFPEAGLALGEVSLAYRPLPGDEFPAVGPVMAGLYLAVMHSGMTLAALMGELVPQEMLAGESDVSAGWLAPYRPERFWANGA
ncbi:NAD(P)/FAD-dependent oxidoreductase [Pacificoceanicola onchidii]|uniref:NAD(P)/FAD-dependent oxidoreductase n=1 Tax=Pacificoceanicola onchidii TaxID=2562685 RepID=UPI001455EAF9|nr:FAD-dependent oxidoreductase [Pacificoceanicola onchidii]